MHACSQGPGVCASACQKRPTLSEIRIAPVIFRFIDFTSFRKRPFDQKLLATVKTENLIHVIEMHDHKGDFHEW
jgi:hypothetical protein